MLDNLPMVKPNRKPRAEKQEVKPEKAPKKPAISSLKLAITPKSAQIMPTIIENVDDFEMNDAYAEPEKFILKRGPGRRTKAEKAFDDHKLAKKAEELGGLVTKEELASCPSDIVNAGGLARVFGVTEALIRTWTTGGMPQEPNGLYYTSECIKWYAEREKASVTGKASMDVRKQLADIAVKEAQAAKILDKYILRNDHENIIGSRASVLRAFLESGAVMNAHRFVGLTLDKATVVLTAFCTQAMNAYTGE